MTPDFNAERHEYSAAGRVYPSVTQIIGSAFPYKEHVNSEKARDLGTRVHEACAAYTMGDHTTDEAVLPYVESFAVLLFDLSVKVIHSELRLYSEALGYAGTIDLVVECDGKVQVWDIKTGTPTPTTGMQLAGYAMLLFDAKITRVISTHMPRAAVHLPGDGTYKLVLYKDPADFAAFNAAQTLANWRKKHGIA